MENGRSACASATMGRVFHRTFLEEGRRGHYGLRGMRERARQIGGKLEIWSGPGSGTEIELSIRGSIAYRTSTGRSVSAYSGRKQDEL